ncbi:MAG TPA: hypothetical protein PK402_06245 [Tepidisphaeraceae bacterium]|nr:hypothetical protein [Tepidisphaeraceae bacterium]
MLALFLAAVLFGMPVTVYADDTEETAPDTETTMPDETMDEAPSDEVPTDEAPTDDGEGAGDGADESADDESPDASTDDETPDETPAPETPPTPAEPTIIEEVDPAIQQLEDYYANAYGKPITKEYKSRLAKIVAVISLSKMDATQMTDILINAIDERDPILSQLAWEAVLARSKSLTPEQRRLWTEAGLRSVSKNSSAFPGVTVAPLLEALAQYPLRDSTNVQRLLERLCKESDPNTAEGAAALDAGGRALAAWNDPKLTRDFFNATMSKARLAERAERMFRQFPETPKDAGKDAWKEWLKKSKFKATPAADLKPFNGTSLFFPAAEKVTPANVNDPKWKQDAELPELQVSALKTVICLDATGSGADLNEFVTAFVDNLAACIDVVADKNQLGVVYYRHEVDPKAKAACCLAIREDDDDFLVRPVPLNSNIPAVVDAMKKIFLNRQKGYDNGGAAYIGGLQTARNMLGGSKRDTISVIALFGDAKGTVGKEAMIPKVTKDIVDDGIIVQFMVRDGRAHNALAQAITESKNEPIYYKDDILLLKDNPNKSSIDIFDNSSFGSLAKRVLAKALPPGYEDRADKIVSATAKILQAKDHALKARAELEDRAPPADDE